MNTREQFTAARRFLRVEPSLFNPRPAEIEAQLWDAAKATMFKAETKTDWTRGTSSRGRRFIEWVSVRPRVTYGCHCKSCMFTNRHTRIRFSKWPCDAPKGKRASDTEYRAHVADLWEGVAKSVPFKPGQAPQYPAWTRGNMPVTPAPKFVLDWINRKKTSPVTAEPVSPATPCKAPQHFPERDRTPEASARIYEMAKTTPKRPVGRPPSLEGGAVRVLVSLDRASIERARKLGGDNVSAGIRKALARRQSG